MQWTQVYDPFGHWWLSTLVAGLPIIVLFGLLGRLQSKTALVRHRRALSPPCRSRFFVSRCRRSWPR